jgi:hypothetical protein
MSDIDPMEAECEQSYLLACELDGRTLLGGCCVAVEVGREWLPARKIVPPPRGH